MEKNNKVKDLNFIISIIFWMVYLTSIYRHWKCFLQARVI